MSKHISSVLLITVLGVAHSSDPLAAFRNNIVSHLQLPPPEIKETRQTDCIYPINYPQECVTALTNVGSLAANINDQSPNDIDLETLNSYFNELCTADCIGPAVQYYDCLGQNDFADFLNSAYCGQSDGTYCLVLWMDGIINYSFAGATICAQDGTCDSSCQTMLQNTVDYLGCCAASLYDNPYGPFYYITTPSQFAACNVDLGSMCPGVSDAGIVNHMGLGLLTIFMVVAALINAVLF